MKCEELENGWYRLKATDYNYVIPAGGSIEVGITAGEVSGEPELSYMSGTRIAYDGDGRDVPKGKAYQVSLVSVRDSYTVGVEEVIQAKVVDENNEAVSGEALTCEVDGGAEVAVLGVTDLAGLADIQIKGLGEGDVTLTVTASNGASVKETIRFEKMKEIAELEAHGFSVHGINVVYWDFDVNTERYVIQRAVADGEYETVKEEEISNYYVDTDVEDQGTYRYKVKAVYPNGVVKTSGVASVTTEGDVGDGTEELDERLQRIVKLDEDYYALDIMYQEPDEAGYVTSDLCLAVIGESGSKVSWTSDMEAVVASDGRVTRPDDDSTDVSLTALSVRAGFPTPRTSLTNSSST